MNYELIEKGIGVVVLGHFNPRQLTKANLIALNVIKLEEEKQTYQDIADERHVVFNVGNLRAMCNQSRFQMTTKDIVMSPRLVLFCQEVVNTIEINNVRGVGLNTQVIVSLPSKTDTEAFSRKLMPPIDDWKLLSGGGAIEEIVIKHDNRTITLFPSSDSSGKQLYEFNVNEHYELNKIVDVFPVFDKADNYFVNEFAVLDNFIRNL